MAGFERKRKTREDSEAPGEERAPKEEREGASAEEESYPRPRSHRELGDAIFDHSNPVRAGCELLESSNEATRLSSLKAFADWAFGKYGVEGNHRPPRIIWDIPGPPYEPQDPELLAAPFEAQDKGALEEEKLGGGEK